MARRRGQTEGKFISLWNFIIWLITKEIFHSFSHSFIDWFYILFEPFWVPGAGGEKKNQLISRLVLSAFEKFTQSGWGGKCEQLICSFSTEHSQCDSAWSYKERTQLLSSGPLSLLGHTDHWCQVQAKPGHCGNTVEEHYIWQLQWGDLLVQMMCEDTKELPNEMTRGMDSTSEKNCRGKDRKGLGKSGKHLWEMFQFCWSKGCVCLCVEGGCGEDEGRGEGGTELHGLILESLWSHWKTLSRKCRVNNLSWLTQDCPDFKTQTPTSREPLQSWKNRNG